MRKGGRRGLRKRFGTAAAEGPAEVGVYRAKVLSVNKVKYTCTVQGELDNQVIEDIPIEPIAINTEGGGSYWMPETNGLVWMCNPSTESTPFIMSGATAPKQLDEDPNEDPTDRRLNRPVIGEGDFVVAQNGTGKIILRKGGIVEIGASESALRRYIPLTNLIEEFSQNWRHNNAAGLMEMICRDQDETYGTERTPAEFKFNLREFCEDTFPMMDLRIGRIKDEDDQSIPSGDIGAVVARLSFDNRATWWVDRDGNIAKRVMGASFESYHAGRKRVTQGSVRDVVNGTLDVEVLSRKTRVNTTDTLDVVRDRKVNIQGNLEETVAKSVTRKVGEVTEESGAVTRNINGSLNETVTGFHSLDLGNNREVSVGGDSSETVTGTKNTVVSAADTANPTATTYQITIQKGGFQVHSLVGKLVFATGNVDAAAALAKLTIKPSGAFVLSSGVGAVTLEQNVSGIKLKTAAGEISLDNAGTVLLGPGPVRGNVITTATFPADLTTGAPILGSPSVQAGNIGVAPGPAAVPSSFIPDVS
jgi:hypothetical protein